jgi:hypothetical protein
MGRFERDCFSIQETTRSEWIGAKDAFCHLATSAADQSKNAKDLATGQSERHIFKGACPAYGLNDQDIFAASDGWDNYWFAPP